MSGFISVTVIRALVTLVLTVPAFWLTMRYNMHMFQLNVYMNGEQRAWIRKNFRLQWILVFMMAAGILRFAISIPAAGRGIAHAAAMTVDPYAAQMFEAASAGMKIYSVLSWVLDVIIWLSLIVIILVYRVMKQMNQKKKLVFTARVKRMVGTIICISVLLMAAAFSVCGGHTRFQHMDLDMLMGSEIGSPLGILTVDYGAAGYITGGLYALNGVLAFIVGSQMWMNMLARTVNTPVEKAVNNHYINDAKRILKSNPDLTVIGVTGSYGKTSVKFFLQTLLQQKYSVLVTPESYNTPMGVVITIRKFMKPSHQIFICEMGARYVGEIKEICDIVHPDHGIITSIGPQHLDTFGSIDNIKKTKFELADALPEGGMLFLNGDSEYIMEHLAELEGSRSADNQDRVAVPDEPGAESGMSDQTAAGVRSTGGYSNVTFYHAASDAGKTSDTMAAMDNNVCECSDVPEAERIKNGYFASDVKVSSLGTEFTVTAPDGEIEHYQMKLVGAHNVINVMGAIAAAHRFGISLRDLRIPVRRLRPVPHRMEMKENGNVTIIDDAFNSNPVGSKAAVETLALFDGVRILITPGMVELGADEDEYNRKFGGYAADCCDWILLVGGRHTEPIREGILEKGFPEKNCLTFAKVEEAIDYAYKIRGQEHKYILLENDLPDNY